MRQVQPLAPTWQPPEAVADLCRAARLWRSASVTDDLRACVDRFGVRRCVSDSTGALSFA